MLRNILALVLLFSSPLLWSQSKKDLKEAGITGRQEETKKAGGTSFMESSEKYDPNGNTTEKIEYDDKGDILLHEKYEYNEKGKMVKEIHVDPISKKERKTIEYLYNGNDRLTGEIHRDRKGEIVKMVEYNYDGNLKKEKKVTDAKGRLLETKTYTYQKN